MGGFGPYEDLAWHPALSHWSHHQSLVCIPTDLHYVPVVVTGDLHSNLLSQLSYHRNRKPLLVLSVAQPHWRELSSPLCVQHRPWPCLVCGKCLTDYTCSREVVEFSTWDRLRHGSRKNTLGPGRESLPDSEALLEWVFSSA